MNAVIYVRDDVDMSIFEQYNQCANYAKRNGFSIKDKVLDFDGKNFYQAVDKAVFNDDIDCVIVYRKSYIGDFSDYLFFKIYLEKFNKQLVSAN